MRRKKNPINSDPKILILEDDLDQMYLLIDFAISEIKRLVEDKNINDEQRQKLVNIEILTAANLEALKQAVSMHSVVLLAVLDCNTPDAEGGDSHDQLVKTNRGITGQHKSVDLVTEYLPDTPIILISSMDRFQRIVNKYYASNHNLSINFIRKNAPPELKRNIRNNLKEYLQVVD